ncbi:MAG: hypothetical protein QUS08_05355 [Methanothrix sp.]|nr:hypothetical protein [Methanothrix sp.]
MNSKEVLECVKERLPGTSVKGHRVHPYRNSRIFVIDLLQGSDSCKVVVKISRNFRPGNVALEYENLSRFHQACQDPQISSPEPLFAEPKEGILAMRYVEGTVLSHMLHEIRPVSTDFLKNAIDLSAVALARFHQLFSWPEGTQPHIDPSAVEEEINRCIKETSKAIDGCSLRMMVTPFFDFTTWNIIVGDGGRRLYLIDFPRNDYIFTPHLDLARFRFGLELIKQFPPARFLGINRWDLEELFDRFLAGYCREMGVQLNEEDLRLICCFRRGYIRRCQDLSRKGDCGLQPRLEIAYLRTFCQDWLDQRGSPAIWEKKARIR